MNTDKNVLLEFKSVLNLVKRYVHKSTIISEFEGLTGMRAVVLGFIGEKTKEGDVFQKDIEAEFEIRRSTATELLKSLEKEGYITKQSVSKDARLKKLVLTEIAQNICENAAASFFLLSKKMLEGLSSEETDVLFSAIDKIKNNLKDMK